MGIYFIKDNKVYKGKTIKLSKRGTAIWVKSNILDKNVLVSIEKCFETESDAVNFLNKEINRKIKVKENKEAKFKEEQKEIDDILGKIYKEFGIEIRLLERPVVLSEAKKLYYNLKRV